MTNENPKPSGEPSEVPQYRESMHEARRNNIVRDQEILRENRRKIKEALNTRPESTPLRAENSKKLLELATDILTQAKELKESGALEHYRAATSTYDKGLYGDRMFEADDKVGAAYEENDGQMEFSFSGRDPGAAWPQRRIRYNEKEGKGSIDTWIAGPGLSQRVKNFTFWTGEGASALGMDDHQFIPDDEMDGDIQEAAKVLADAVDRIKKSDSETRATHQ